MYLNHSRGRKSSKRIPRWAIRPVRVWINQSINQGDSITTVTLISMMRGRKGLWDNWGMGWRYCGIWSADPNRVTRYSYLHCKFFKSRRLTVKIIFFFLTYPNRCCSVVPRQSITRLWGPGTSWVQSTSEVGQWARSSGMQLGENASGPITRQHYGFFSTKIVCSYLLSFTIRCSRWGIPGLRPSSAILFCSLLPSDQERMAIFRSIEICWVHWWLCASHAKILTKSQPAKFFARSAICHRRNRGWRSTKLRPVWNFECISRSWTRDSITVGCDLRVWEEDESRLSFFRVSLSGLGLITKSKATKSWRPK